MIEKLINMPIKKFGEVLIKSLREYFDERHYCQIAPYVNSSLMLDLNELALKGNSIKPLPIIKNPNKPNYLKILNKNLHKD